MDKFIVTCPSCGSAYNTDSLDNCKQCGSPVEYRIEPDQVVHHIGNSTPMVITRMPDYEWGDATIFRAEKMIDGRKYSAAIRVTDFLLTDPNFDVREHIVRQFKHKMAMTMAEEMEILFGEHRVHSLYSTVSPWEGSVRSLKGLE